MVIEFAIFASVYFINGSSITYQIGYVPDIRCLRGCFQTLKSLNVKSDTIIRIGMVSEIQRDKVVKIHSRIGTISRKFSVGYNVEMYVQSVFG